MSYSPPSRSERRPRIAWCWLIALASLSALWLGFGTTPGAAQTPRWQIYSPLPGTTISGERVFVMAHVVRGDAAEVARDAILLVDGKAVATRVNGGGLRALLATPLAPGSHRFELRSRSEAWPTFQWSATVPTSGPGSTDAAQAGRARRGDVEGTISTFTRGTSISGDGAALRQEPEGTSHLRLDARGTYGAWRLPVRLYLTTDETGRAQPRHRFSVGLEGPHLRIYGGDIFPTFQPLVLDGARFRGGQAEVHAGPLHAYAARGLLRRGIEGIDPLVGFGGPQGGAYRRSATALRLAVGQQRGFLLGLGVLRATDRADSVDRTLAATPGQNVVAGADASLYLWRALRLSGGAAFSLTTTDTRLGAITQAQADSVFEVELPFDPLEYDHYFILNTTTTPLIPAELTSLAWFARLVSDFSMGGTHRFEARARSVGSSFTSYANPFLIRDRRGLTLTERYASPARRLTASVRASFEEDDLSGSRGMRRTQRRVDMRASWQPTASLPRLTASLRLSERESEPDATGFRFSQDYLRGGSLGAFYALRTGRWQHALHVQGTHQRRSDRIRPQLSSTTSLLNITLLEDPPGPFAFDGEVGLQWAETDGPLVLPGQERWSLRARYRPRPTLEAALRAGRTTTDATDFAGKASRWQFDATGRLRLPAYRVTLELAGGLNRYRERDAGMRAYDETFVVLRTRYDFGR